MFPFESETLDKNFTRLVKFLSQMLLTGISHYVTLSTLSKGRVRRARNPRAIKQVSHRACFFHAIGKKFE